MRFHLLTMFPDLVRGHLSASIIARARDMGKVDFSITNLADYSVKNTRRVDDRPYGWLPGTIIMAEPIAQAIEAIQKMYGETTNLVMSARGQLWTHALAETMARETRDTIVLCGHYEGIDQRVIEAFHFREISIGEYVLTSGELSGLVVVDSITRLIDGVISDESTVEESYSSGLSGKKEYPQYTRPSLWRDRSVPTELLSGDPRVVADWKARHTS